VNPGILLIVEAEDVGRDGCVFDDEDGLLLLVCLMENCIEIEGFYFLTMVPPTPLVNGNDEEENDVVVVVIIMREGNVVLRVHKDAVQYCGVGIHLWGSFDRLDNLKKGLVSAVYMVLVVVIVHCRRRRIVLLPVGCMV